MKTAQDKTILMVVNNAFLARSFLRSGLLNALKKSFAKVVILTPFVKLERYQADYAGDNVVVEAIPKSSTSFSEKFLFHFLKYSIPSEMAKTLLMGELFEINGLPRINSRWLFSPLLLLSWYCSRFRFWRQFLRKIFRSLKDDQNCLAVLEKHQPDIVFARYSLTASNNFNLRLFKAAASMKIPTVGMIFSWDNLYGKVFAATPTDLAIVGTKIVKEEAQRFCDIVGDSIRVTGLPQFDFYFRKDILLERDAFLRSLGLDPSKRLILFAMGTNNFNNVINEEHFLGFLDRLAQEELPDVQFFARNHPKGKFKQEMIDKFRNSSNIIFEKKDDYKTGSAFEFPKNDEQILFNLLYHADLLITFCSTIIIESCLLDTPIININYSGRQKENSYYYRIERFKEFEHIKQIERNNCFRWAHNDRELLQAIKDYLADKTRDEEGRAKTAQEQVYFKDGLSHQRVAEFLKEVAYG